MSPESAAPYQLTGMSAPSGKHRMTISQLEGMFMTMHMLSAEMRNNQLYSTVPTVAQSVQNVRFRVYRPSGSGNHPVESLEC